jgi:predicted GNAT superfamily acetyltransferase
MSKFQSALYRVAEIKDFNLILEINTEGKPGVVPLDRAELLRLMNLTDYVKVLEIHGQVARYFIAFLKNSNYDGEEFQCFRKESNNNFLYVD